VAAQPQQPARAVTARRAARDVGTVFIYTASAESTSHRWAPPDSASHSLYVIRTAAAAIQRTTTEMPTSDWSVAGSLHSFSRHHSRSPRRSSSSATGRLLTLRSTMQSRILPHPDTFAADSCRRPALLPIRILPRFFRLGRLSTDIELITGRLRRRVRRDWRTPSRVLVSGTGCHRRNLLPISSSLVPSTILPARRAHLRCLGPSDAARERLYLIGRRRPPHRVACPLNLQRERKLGVADRVAPS